jgi:quercetin dioxygenase-like cupin family protein
MSDAPNEPRRPDPQPIAASYLEFDVARELEQLHREAGWQSGRNARTLVKYDGLRIVLIALQKGSRIPEHHANGHVSIHAVVGHIEVRAQERRFELRGGALLVLGEGVSHDVEALEESALLLTIGSSREKDPSVP